MSTTTFSGPVRSLAGFITPITYVNASDVVSGVFSIPTAGANVVILTAADGGPAGAITLELPLVTTPDGGAFTEYNSFDYFDGIKGSVLNYGVTLAHTLQGAVDPDTGLNQAINGSANGVAIPIASVIQWGGNGNPVLPWAAIETPLATPL